MSTGGSSTHLGDRVVFWLCVVGVAGVVVATEMSFAIGLSFLVGR